ncbi:MAG TPA: hypothetical protein VLM40_10035, partial [Gemmata sp.]|nr:hypothetical protein [Gemmata sp.]
ESDIGALRVVQVRWRDASGAAAVVKCREGCLWDITERGAELTACYLVRIEQGAVPSLSFEIPAELDPFRVAVRSLDDAGVASLKDWTLGAESKGYRPLKLGFRMPITGPILVVLALAPREVLNRQPVLRFPRVIGPSGETDAVYGLRANGVEIEELRRGGVIDFSPDALTRDFAVVTDLRLDPQTPIRVFRPTPGGTPVLRPTLRLSVEQPVVSLDTTWQVSQLKAHASGQVRWTSKEPVSMLEFNVGTLRLSEVRGPDVDQWVQNGARVQLWLKRPLSEGEINWCASIAKTGAPFNAITPRPLNARLLASVVRIIPTEGFGLQFVRDSGWTPDVSTPARFHTTDPLTPPIRVNVVRVPPVLHEEEFGWLSPRAAAVPSRPPDAARVASATPVVEPKFARTTIDGEELRESRWVARVSSAIGWSALLVLLAILQLRLPRSTWPEQFGIIGGLIGAAVAGMWWVGIAAWAVARLVCFAEELVHRQYRPV